MLKYAGVEINSKVVVIGCPDFKGYQERYFPKMRVIFIKNSKYETTIANREELKKHWTIKTEDIKKIDNFLKD